MHSRNRQLVVEIKVSAVRFVRKTKHTVLMRELNDALYIRTDTVIRRIVHEDRLRVRILLNGLFKHFNAHSERYTKPRIGVGIDVNGNSSAYDQRAYDAPMNVSRKDYLISSLERREHHALHGRRSSANH